MYFKVHSTNSPSIGKILAISIRTTITTTLFIILQFLKSLIFIKTIHSFFLLPNFFQYKNLKSLHFCIPIRNFLLWSSRLVPYPGNLFKAGLASKWSWERKTSPVLVWTFFIKFWPQGEFLGTGSHSCRNDIYLSSH